MPYGQKSKESRSLGVERKLSGNLHSRLNIGGRSIVNKYPEGKLKSTSKGELKDLKSSTGKRVHMTFCGNSVAAVAQHHLKALLNFS